jgi:TorA maturation chaperone TorD
MDSGDGDIPLSFGNPMETSQIVARAEFYLMLSRAFLPPTAEESFAAFVDILPGELAEISEAAGYANGDLIRDYAAAAEGLANRINLLQTYAGLFLQPPREVQLNVSVYLDGSILGRSADALEAFYAKHGLGRADTFRDLHDHLSVVLEFLALLFGKAAETDGYPRADLLNDATELNRHFLLAWVPVMGRQIAKALAEHQERGHSPVYLILTQILQEALVADAGKLTPELEHVLDPKTEISTNEAESKEMALCTGCGAAIAPAARIRRVRKVLEKEGIDTAHLDLCPKCRGVDLFPAGGQFPLV